MNPGDSYTDSVSVTIPYTITGQYNLFVEADAPITRQEDGDHAQLTGPGGAVYEPNDVGKVSAAIPITISSKLAQLQVSNVTVTPPAGGLATGQDVTVGWTVSNTGTATTSSSHWYDDVYISPTATFDAKTAVYLGSAYDNNPLAAGGQLNDSLSVLVPPSLPAGTYYFIVLADRPIAPPGVPIENVDQTVDLVVEPNEFDAGASAAAEVAAGPTPDLTTTITTAPTSTVSGQYIQVNWIVTNNGADTLPPDGHWYDEIYLSLDTTLDQSAIPLGSVTHAGELLGSESSANSYTAGGSFELPVGLSGNYYILVVADADGSLFESKPNDRIAVSAQTLDISLQPPIDLVAGTVTVPASAVPGEPITVTYTVSNNSANSNPGDWYDALYLSTTTTWQLSNPLLGRVLHKGGVAANGQYSETLTAPLPGVTPGTYYVILRSDIRGMVPETDSDDNVNNLSASSQISLDVPSITAGMPGTPATGSLTQGSSAFYKVTVAAGQTLQLSLTDTAANDVNGLYVSSGVMPSPGHSDFSGGQTLVADQTITIASTQAGTYYIQVANRTVSGYDPQSNPNVTANYSLAASIIPFSVTAASPDQVGNAGSSTLKITGAKFDRATTFQLIDSQGNVIQAGAVYVQDSATAYATFDLTGISLGTYDVQATAADGSTTKLSSGLSVVNGVGPYFDSELDGPPVVLQNRQNVFHVVYRNTGDADEIAPLLVLTSPTGTVFGPSPAVEGSPAVMQFIAASADGPAGILRPGAAATVDVSFLSSANVADPFSFYLTPIFSNDSTPIDWNQLALRIVPFRTQVPNWSAVFAELQQMIGPTVGDYVSMLAANATLIPRANPYAFDVDTPLDLEVQKATAAVSTSITGAVQAQDTSVPISGLTIHAQNLETGDTYATTTLNDGSFIFDQVEAGDYQFSIDNELITSGGTATVGAGQALTGVSLSIASGDQLSGQVTAKQGGGAIAGATLTLSDSAGDAYSAQSDSAGNFQFAGVPDGTYRLVADAAGQARTISDGINISSTPTTINVAMVPEAIITGAVQLPANGPRGGALSVLAQPPGNTDPDQEYTAGAVGATSFTVNGLPAGTYDLTISDDGYVPQTLTGVTVTVGGSVSIGTIALVPAASVSGTLTSDDAQWPAAGAEVGIYDSSGNLIDSTTVDNSGNFSFTGLVAGTYTVESVGATDFVTPATITLTAGQSLGGVSIEQQPGATISGAVTEATGGNPIAGAVVYLSDADGNVSNTTTDANGNYSFANLGLGVYSVYLDPGAATYQSLTVSSLDGQSLTANLQLSVQGELKGQLLAADGTPVADGTIDLYQSGTLIDSAAAASDGTYDILLLQPGTFDLQAYAPGASFAPVTGVAIAAGQTVVQNFTAGNATLQVTLTDSMQSVAGANVVLQQQTADGFVTVGSAVVAADGLATFNNLAAGSYSLLVTSSNDRGALATTTVTAGASNQAAVPLVQGSAETGTVTDSSGNPLAGASVTLISEANPAMQQVAITASDGSYTIHNVLNGTYDLVVAADGYESIVQTGITASDPTLQLTKHQATVSGKIVDPAGDPAPGLLVSVVNSKGYVIAQTHTKGDGSFTIKGGAGTGLHIRVQMGKTSVDDPYKFDDPPGSTTNVQVPTFKLPADKTVKLITKLTKLPAVKYVPQSWLKKTISDVELDQKADYDPLIDELPASNDCPACQSAYSAAQSAAQNQYKLGADLTIKFKELVGPVQQARNEFNADTESFLKEWKALAEAEFKAAVSAYVDLGKGDLFQDTLTSAADALGKLASALKAIESASSQQKLLDALTQFDQARASAAQDVANLIAEWNTAALTAPPGAAVELEKLLSAFQAASQFLSSDPYAGFRNLVSQIQEVSMKLKFFAKYKTDGYDAGKKAIEDYEKCVAEHEADNTCTPKPPQPKQPPPKPPKGPVIWPAPTPSPPLDPPQCKRWGNQYGPPPIYVGPPPPTLAGRSFGGGWCRYCAWRIWRCRRRRRRRGRRFIGTRLWRRQSSGSARPE